jgi:hypothetical protein
MLIEDSSGWVILGQVCQSMSVYIRLGKLRVYSAG